jgi:hypothetical protein
MIENAENRCFFGVFFCDQKRAKFELGGQLGGQNPIFTPPDFTPLNNTFCTEFHKNTP